MICACCKVEVEDGFPIWGLALPKEDEVFTTVPEPEGVLCPACMDIGCRPDKSKDRK